MNARIVLGLVLLLGFAVTTGRAQRTVTGTITMLERGGAARADLGSAIVYLQGGPPESRDRTGDTIPERATIAMRGREFLPHVQVVRTGGSVGFPNQDPFSHNVFSNTEGGSFDLGLYRRGSTRTATFANAGVHPIYCNIHSRMVSFVVAVPTRHAARVLPDGRFLLAGVAPGSYRLHVWHERAAAHVQTLVVGDADVAVRATIDARGHVAGAHLNKFGQPYAVTRTDRYE